MAEDDVGHRQLLQHVGRDVNAIHVDSVAILGGGGVDVDDDGWGSDIDPNDTDSNNPGPNRT